MDMQYHTEKYLIEDVVLVNLPAVIISVINFSQNCQAEDFRDRIVHISIL